MILRILNQLEQADDQIHEAENRFREQGAEVEKLFKVARSLRLKTDYLDHENRDQRQRKREVQIGGLRPEERREDVAFAIVRFGVDHRSDAAGELLHFIAMFRRV